MRITRKSLLQNITLVILILYIIVGCNPKHNTHIAQTGEASQLEHFNLAGTEIGRFPLVIIEALL
ncbi:hypothetical protein D6B99_14490 [Arachidicoccus soli]|uniref:Uncharacterized protein n=1 Tax=Arachidicoccus soli TaxID=2341117 RepID=A0A386HT64_9BACT|nr:hypothetical protein D6B99_14490 [Arachidicoccus soli]